MSVSLTKAKPYLILFLDRLTSANQQYALLQTASDFQAKAVAEILYNLSSGVLPLSKNTKLLIKKYKKLFKSVSEGSVKSKINLIRSKYKRVCEILISAKRLILELLR